ncbi:MAG: hypothetical protein AAFO94_00430 [Bacteroidota bacterium]
MQQLGDQFNESIDAIRIDEDGNFYIAGLFFEQITLGDTTLLSRGQSDIYLAKLDSQGQVIWAQRGGSDFADVLEAIQLGPDGQLYCTGSYFVEADFAKAQLKDTRGPKAIFLCKYTPQGNLVWATDLEGSNFKAFPTMAIDADANITLAGYFQDSLFVQDTILSADNGADLALVQFDSSGQRRWLRQVNTTNEYRPAALKINTKGELIVAGSYKGVAIFGNDTLRSNTADFDVFVAAFDPEGRARWGRKAGGVHEDQCTALALDEQNRIYLTGQYFGVMKLSEEISIQTDGFNNNFYLLQYAADGTPFRARSLGNPMLDEAGNALLINGSTVYLAGTFRDQLDIDGKNIQGGAGSFDGFVAAFDTTTQLKWIQSIPASNIVLPELLVQREQSIFVAGSFIGTAGFDAQSLNTDNHFDLFIARLSETLTPVAATVTQSAFQLYPNPTRTQIFIESPINNYWVKLYDPFGKLLLEKRNPVSLSLDQ